MGHTSRCLWLRSSIGPSALKRYSKRESGERADKRRRNPRPCQLVAVALEQDVVDQSRSARFIDGLEAARGWVKSVLASRAWHGGLGLPKHAIRGRSSSGTASKLLLHLRLSHLETQKPLLGGGRQQPLPLRDVAAVL